MLSYRRTICMETITNENLKILFLFRIGINQFPQIFFHICFRNHHVGHAQEATLTK